jgi:acylphosphatase
MDFEWPESVESPPMDDLQARRYGISGRVQGVGYRYFAQRAAREIGVTGWARNLDDGSVEVHANGTMTQLENLESRLRRGPRSADVRSVEVIEAVLIEATEFYIR